MNLSKLAVAALFIVSFCHSAESATTPAKKVLCVNGSSQVFARPKCLAAETPFLGANPTPTPTPTSTSSSTKPLDLNTCRKVAVTTASVVGVATAAFQCDISKEFVLEYGFTTSDGFNSDATVRSQQVTYATGGTLPVGVSITMGGSRSRNYNLNLTATCCKR